MTTESPTSTNDLSSITTSIDSSTATMIFEEVSSINHESTSTFPIETAMKITSNIHKNYNVVIFKQMTENQELILIIILSIGIGMLVIVMSYLIYLICKPSYKYNVAKQEDLWI